MTIFSNGIPLSSYPITQDETGPSHINLKYASGVRQLPLDFGNQRVDYPITMDVDCRVTYRSSSQGNYIVVLVGEFKFMFVHVYQHAALNSLVPAGGVICRIAPTSQNGGYAVHLHTSCRKNDAEYPIRSVIYDTGLVIGSNVEFLSGTNIRTGPGTGNTDIGDVAVGAVAKLVGGPSVANGYTWYECKFLDISGWCFSNHMKPSNKLMTKSDGTIPVDPCQAKLDALKAEYEKKLAEKDAEIAKVRDGAHAEVSVLTESANRLSAL